MTTADAPAVRTIVLALALTSGCAFGARHVNLTYGPGLPAVSPVPPKYGRVAVMPLGDARAPDSRGNVIAKVRNGYGMPTASVIANQDPLLWVTEGVARALVLQGFTVERVASTTDLRDTPIVTGQVTRASGGMYMSTSANVAAELAIQYRGRVVQTIPCMGSASNVAWTASANEFGSVFEEAMREFSAQCGPRLTNALMGGAAP
jgi:hypothetical protein